MMSAVLASLFIPRKITFNTILWEHWNIFSKARYLWKVIRKKTDWVKLPLFDGRIFVCKPHGREYMPLLLSKSGNGRKLSKQPIQLDKAVKICETQLTEMMSRKNVSSLAISRTRCYLPPIEEDPVLGYMFCPGETIEEKKKAFANKRRDFILQERLTLGALSIHEKDIDYVMNYNNRPYCLFDIVHEIVRDDVEPSQEQLDKLSKCYKDTELLSKKEAQILINK